MVCDGTFEDLARLRSRDERRFCNCIAIEKDIVTIAAFFLYTFYTDC